MAEGGCGRTVGRLQDLESHFKAFGFYTKSKWEDDGGFQALAVKS